MHVNIYLSFNGECAAAFEYYEQCLGGEIKSRVSYADTPASREVPQAWQAKMLHAEISINGQLIMGSDARPDEYAPPTGFAIELGVATPGEAASVFAALAEQGRVELPLHETFWAQSYGRLRDKFGQPWMISCSKAA